MAEQHLNHRSINDAALEYWRLTRCPAERISELCAELDRIYMFALASFEGEGRLDVRLSTRTWERQQGHFPTVTKFFGELAANPRLRDRKGKFVVWLEDGLWEPEQYVGRMVPCFTFGRHEFDTASLLMPDPAFIESHGYHEDLVDLARLREIFPWQGRRDTIFWRGAASGYGMPSESWVETQRGKLVLAAAKLGKPEILDAKFSSVAGHTQEQQEIFHSRGVVGSPVPFEDFLSYKYQVDADGISCAWRSLFLKLASGSPVLKIQGPWQQWYYPILVPWKHYVALDPDVSRVQELYEWLVARPEEAQQIAYNGQQLVESITYEHAVEEMIVSLESLLDS